MIILLALYTFLLSLSNLWLWIKVYKLENKTDIIVKSIAWWVENIAKKLMGEDHDCD